MRHYDRIRHRYKPARIAVLLIAESPPPSKEIQSSRHFYRSDRIRVDDRLFTNTIWALYPEAKQLSEQELEMHKSSWLRRLQADGIYMIEALTVSQHHEVTKQQRQAKIAAELPNLIRRVTRLVDKHTSIILIKSNVFLVAAEPLRQAGFQVLNSVLVDYPGQFNQRDYREKLSTLVRKCIMNK